MNSSLINKYHIYHSYILSLQNYTHRCTYSLSREFSMIINYMLLFKNIISSSYDPRIISNSALVQQKGYHVVHAISLGIVYYPVRRLVLSDRRESCEENKNYCSSSFYERKKLNKTFIFHAQIIT